MTRVATRRLVDAAATLDVADRALLNIWVNRALDDRELARMTGLDDATLAARRHQIVLHLGATLGLPPQIVRSALDEIAVSADAHPPAGLAAPPPSAGPPHSEADASAVRAATGDSSSRRRRWLWGVPLIMIVVAAVLIVSLQSGRSRHSPRAATAARATVPAAAAPATVPASPGSPAAAPAPASPASPAPARSPATATRLPGDPLVALAGGPAHASGTVRVTGRRPHLRLHLSVSNLPAASHGHYEIWLYDSILNALDLGRLGNSVSRLSYRLPPEARRYRWVDISLQPPGAVFHSGESLLRSANPVFEPHHRRVIHPRPIARRHGKGGARRR